MKFQFVVYCKSCGLADARTEDGGVVGLVGYEDASNIFELSFRITFFGAPGVLIVRTYGGLVRDVAAGAFCCRFYSFRVSLSHLVVGEYGQIRQFIR